MTHIATRSLESIFAELDARSLLAEAATVARRHDVTLRDMFGPRRLPQFAAARHEWWAYLRGRAWSYPRIAEMTNHDHTTVMAGVKNHYRRLIMEAKGNAA